MNERGRRSTRSGRTTRTRELEVGRAARGTNDGARAASAGRSGGEPSSASEPAREARETRRARAAEFLQNAGPRKQSGWREGDGHAEDGDAGAGDAALEETRDTTARVIDARSPSDGDDGAIGDDGAMDVGEDEVVGAGGLGGGLGEDEDEDEVEATEKSRSRRSKNGAARAKRAPAKPQRPVKRRSGAGGSLGRVKEKRRKRKGVTSEEEVKRQERYKAARKEAGARRGGKVLTLPSDKEHLQHGLEPPYTAECVFQIVKNFFETSRAAPNAGTFVTYGTYLRKFLTWEFRDWLTIPESRRAVHPYQFSSAKIKRFLQECFSANSRPDDDEAQYDATLSAHADIQFGVSGLKACNNGLTLLWDALRTKDAMMRKEWKDVAERADSSREAREAAQAKLSADDDAYAFSSCTERNTLKVSQLECWSFEKQRATALERSLAAGGRTRGGFGNTADLLRPIHDNENEDLTEWLRDARRSDASSYLTCHTVVGCSRVIEHFLARPSDVLELKYADMSVLRAQDVLNAMAPVPHVILTINKHKGSMATSKAELKSAIRHSDVTQCGVSALFEFIWANFTVAEMNPPDFSERDDSHSRARRYPQAVDAKALLQESKRKMITWHGRHVISSDRMSAGKKKKKQMAKSDFVGMAVNSIGDLLRQIRQAMYVENSGQSDEARVSKHAHTMHRRSSNGNKMVIRGCAVRGIEYLAGWLDGNKSVSRQHYLHLPPPQALIAAAGCKDSYYLEFERDTLYVSSNLREKTFPFLQELRERRHAFERDGWPLQLKDDKIDGFIDVLDLASEVLWQDWAVTRALEELYEQREAAEQTDASDGDDGDAWNFWRQDFFADAGDDWQTLCDEARQRVSEPDAKIPAHVQGRDPHMAQVFAVAKQTLDMQKVSAADVRRLDNDIRRLSSHVQALQDTMAMLTSPARPALGGSIGAIGEAAQQVEPAQPAQPAERAFTVNELKKIGKGCTKENCKHNVVTAFYSWKELEETFTLSTLDEACRKYLQGKRSNFAGWFRVLERFAEDNARGVYGNSKRNRQNDALRSLQNAAFAEHGEGLAGVYDEFMAGVAAARKKKECNTDHFSEIEYASNFTVKLSQMYKTHAKGDA